MDLDSSFLRRRQEIVIPPRDWSLDPHSGMLGGARTCRVLHLHNRSSKSLIKSYKKKGSPVLDVSVVR